MAAFSAAIFIYGHSEAKVHGVCSNCHTMHNSQNASSMVQDPIAGQSAGGECQACHAEPRTNLLTYNCIGCHAKDTGGSAIDSPGTLDIPQIYYGEANELAAGNFKWVAGFENEPFGHNVHGFTDIGTDSFLEPPGYVYDMDPAVDGQKYTDWPYSSLVLPQQVLCAGAYGCHGSRAIEDQTLATYGAHHSDDSALDFGATFDINHGTSPGTSYRFLSGVKGAEDSDWEYMATSTEHNEYLGRDVTAREGSESQSSVTTMSEFCASCHGNFHMTGLSDGRGISTGNPSTNPWIRHPSDMIIPSSVPYSNYNTYMELASDDKQTVRIARIESELSSIAGTAGAGNTTDISGDTAVVFCLSCHKAHASEYEDALRFSYSQMVTGSAAAAGTGCFACHNDKDG